MRNDSICRTTDLSLPRLSELTSRASAEGKASHLVGRDDLAKGLPGYDVADPFRSETGQEPRDSVPRPGRDQTLGGSKASGVPTHDVPRRW